MKFKKLFIISIILIVAVGCGEDEVKDIEQVESITVDDSNLTDALSNNDCQCPGPFKNAQTQIKIPYEHNFLKFCAFDYSEKDSAVAEFQVFDQNDSLIFRGDLPSQFQIMSFSSPFYLKQFTMFPSENIKKWKMSPIFDYRITSKGASFNIETKFILQQPLMTKLKMDSLLTIFQKQPKHDNNWDKFNPPFTSENYVMELFICAINGNNKCIKAHDSLRTRFVTDGAISELYLELNGFLQLFKYQK